MSPVLPSRRRSDAMHGARTNYGPFAGAAPQVARWISTARAAHQRRARPCAVTPRSAAGARRARKATRRCAGSLRQRPPNSAAKPRSLRLVAALDVFAKLGAAAGVVDARLGNRNGIPTAYTAKAEASTGHVSQRYPTGCGRAGAS